MPIIRFYAFLICLASFSAVASADDTFEAKIRPLLERKCGKCHSQNRQKGGLNLASLDSIRQGGESGEPLVSETLDDSLLWVMVDGGDMPPEDEPPLSVEERELLRAWIVSGTAEKDLMEVPARKLNQHDVLPVLLLRCTTCHGPRRQDGDLDLRTRQAMLKGGASGPALIPGDPDSSLIIRRIESEACPPRDLLLKFFVKRPPQSEVRLLRDWIAAGAHEGDIAPDVATTAGDPLVSDEDRRHWAFQPLAVREGSLDQFVDRRLRAEELTPAREADRDTLIRRAHIDLLGLPPGLSEWRRWRDHADADWYAQMIEHLLRSPRYGERWGRYWLDVAGYADSEGGVSADPVRPVAWKYRDYVIRSFNDDKPYDRFLLEQIAGDELIDHESASVITTEMVDNLIATGFLRMGIDQTGSRTMNFVPERLGVIADVIDVLGSGVMGLTLGCARCHSHKYDALPQRDYYRLKAIFQGALDEHDWLSFKTRSLNVGTLEHRELVRATNPALTKKLKSLQAQQKRASAELRLELLRQHYPEQSEADRRATLVALKTADNNRTLPQRILVEMLQRVEVLPDAQQPPSVQAALAEVARLDAEMIDTQRALHPPLTIRALWDRGAPSPTYVLMRGEHNRPGTLVGPGVPSVLTDGKTPFVVEPPFPSGTHKTGRRLAFARWLIRPDNPLTARVMVNRIWYHHFGQGLVATLENFGVKGDQPSHPELLDWLAGEFVSSGWSIKQVHRLIMNSATYRRSSRVTAEQARIDPQNRLLSHMSLRRMNAEALRDSLLLVAGRLDEAMGGPPEFISVDREGQVSTVLSPDGGWRRSVYLQYRRTEIPTMMDTFDYPEMGPNCTERSVSTVSLQSLMLLNNEHIRELAASFAQRVGQMVDERASGQQNDQDLVRTVYQLALSRLPNEEEQQVACDTLRQLRIDWQGDRDAALETFCHTILNSAAFLYVD